MTDYLPLERAPAKQIADHAWNLNITEIDALEDVIVDTLPLKKSSKLENVILELAMRGIDSDGQHKKNRDRVVSYPIL